MIDRWITDWERSEPDWMPCYPRANAGETLPDPASPLGWTLAWERGFVPGDVLVAPFTDAAWTPLFLVAGAVVVDLGAINSHAMVVARELGIPFVVSVQDATLRIPDDALIAVDGTAGTVTVMAPSAGDRVAAS